MDQSENENVGTKLPSHLLDTPCEVKSRPFGSSPGVVLVLGLGLTLIEGCHNGQRDGLGAAGAEDKTSPSANASVSVSPLVDADCGTGTEEEPGADESPPRFGAIGLGDAGCDASDGAAKFGSLPPRTVYLNGPDKIASKATQAWVHLYPDDESEFLGYLRAGAIVDRSETAVAFTKRCKSGWYEVLPRGYLCGGRRATINLDDPVVVASWKRPKRGDPLPYAYVRPGERLPYLYFTLPSKREQERVEREKLDELLAKHPASKLPNADQMPPPEAMPPFLAPGKELPTPYGATKRLRYRSHEGRANPQAAFAVLSTHDVDGRLFGLTTELDLIAIDRTKIVKPTSSHGGPVEDLPAGVVQSYGAIRYAPDDAGKLQKSGELVRRQVVSLTGKTDGGMLETHDGQWVPVGALRVIQPRTSFPSFAADGKKWLDISIKEQLLIAYVGTRAVYVAVISTGLGELADPTKSFATVRGVFTVRSKHVTDTMNGSAQADDYELADVPYVQYFHEGYALHGTFWHDDFGRVRSHGCVNLTPVDAAWIFEWTEPSVPPEWHGVLATDDQPSSIVYVHP